MLYWVLVFIVLLVRVKRTDTKIISSVIEFEVKVEDALGFKLDIALVCVEAN